MDRWIKSQQVGLLAYYLADADRRSRRHSRLVRALSDTLITDRLDDTGDYPRRYIPKGTLHSLPLSTLFLLSNIAPDYDNETDDLLFPIHKTVDKRIAWLLSTNDSSSSRQSKARTWVDHVQYAPVNAERLIKLGESLFGLTWKFLDIKDSDLTNLDKALAIIRNNWTTTTQRCDAILPIINTVQEGPTWTSTQIENHLLHRQFAWPLLVLGQGVGVSLPIAVDIHYDEDASDELAVDNAEGFIDVGNWNESLRRSILVAKKLWRSKRGNYGMFRDIIESKATVVTFDFSYARKIIQVLAETGAIELPIPFTDRSAEAYLAQVVLGKLLGSFVYSDSLATGLIGDQKTNKYGEPILDWQFAMPNPSTIPHKLAYAFASQGFENIVLPQNAVAKFHQYIEDRDLPTQSAKVKFVSTLSSMSDIIQEQGWRQYTYVRCPDLLWDIHSRHRPGLIEEKYVQVQEILEFFRDNNSPVISVQFAPREIASALWHINTSHRLNQDPVPPSLSWAFIRVRDYDTDMSFWQILWEVLGAPPEDIESFYKEPNIDRTVEHLSTALNRFKPNFSRLSHRAPDIIVIVGGEHLDSRLEETLTPSSRFFSVPIILDRLNEELVVNPAHEWLSTVLGRTRIIVTDEPDDSPSAVPPAVFRYFNMDHPLHTLSIFEGGFTQYMADTLFDGIYTGQTLREQILTPLINENILKKIGDTYFTPSHIRSTLIDFQNSHDTDSCELALRHYRAACSLAPYVNFVEIPSVSRKDAFRAEYIYEAYSHFNKAMSLSWKKDMAIYNNSRRAKRHILLYLSIPWWGTVTGLLGLRDLPSYAYDMSKALMKWEIDTNNNVHPNHLIIAAISFWKYAKSARGDFNEPHEPIWEEARALFKEAIGHEGNDHIENYSIRVYALSNYIAFLLEDDKFDEAIIQASLLVNVVNDRPPALVRSSVRRADGAAIERVADKIEDHNIAKNVYRAGMLVCPRWSQLWIKGLGAARLVKDTEMYIDSVINELADDDDLKALISKSMGFRKKEYLKSSTSRTVARRLQEGMQLFNGEFQ